MNLQRGPGVTLMPDNLTPEQRRKTMQAVRGRNTSLEKAVASALHKSGLRFRRCDSSLPGKPDFVFVRPRLAVFVDGDFWHGWQFPRWSAKLTEYWRQKIERNRRRDHKNIRRLRRLGWGVVRIWEHEVCCDLPGVVARISAAVHRLDVRCS